LEFSDEAAVECKARNNGGVLPGEAGRGFAGAHDLAARKIAPANRTSNGFMVLNLRPADGQATQASPSGLAMVRANA
jgi:hypothetical protein